MQELLVLSLIGLAIASAWITHRTLRKAGGASGFLSFVVFLLVMFCGAWLLDRFGPPAPPPSREQAIGETLASIQSAKKCRKEALEKASEYFDKRDFTNARWWTQRADECQRELASALVRLRQLEAQR